MNSERRMARSWLALAPSELAALACVASLSGCEWLFPVDQFMDGGDSSTRTIRDAGGPKTETSDASMDLSARDGSDDALDATDSPYDGPESSSSGSSGGDSGDGDEAGHGGLGTSSSSGSGDASDGSSGFEPSPTDGSVPGDAAGTRCGSGVCPLGERCCNPCGGSCVSATAGVACPYDTNPAIVCAGATP